jgi:hypothetical protein
MNLSAVIADLNNQIAALKERIDCLDQENAALRQQNIRLRCENDSLKERLGLNSTNSSLPPSRDLYRAKRHNRPRSDKKPGAQPGHKYQGYQLKAPNEVIDVFPGHCSCGSVLEIDPVFHAEQKIEIPPLAPYVTEYRLYKGVAAFVARRRRLAFLKASGMIY